VLRSADWPGFLYVVQLSARDGGGEYQRVIFRWQILFFSSCKRFSGYRVQGQLEGFFWLAVVRPDSHNTSEEIDVASLEPEQRTSP
jgi:hypothetical protein